MRIILGIAATLLSAIAAFADAPASRTVDATYVAVISNIPADAGKLTVWLPLPMSRAAQTVSNVTIGSPYTWHRATEGEFGDEYAWAEMPAPLTGEMMRVRRQTVEHPFGTIKYWMGWTHFLTKTLARVRTEMSLHVLAYNLKRVMRILGIGAMMRAMSACAA